MRRVRRVTYWKSRRHLACKVCSARIDLCSRTMGEARRHFLTKLRRLFRPSGFLQSAVASGSGAGSVSTQEHGQIELRQYPRYPTFRMTFAGACLIIW